MQDAPTETRETGPRLRLRIAYDGAPFEGWQSQARGNTVQDRLEAAFGVLCGGQRVVVHGSGRTDAGVHARGQVAHVDLPPDARLPLERWAGALNANLPAAIRVKSARLAPPDFHARFSAKGKVYRYRIWNSPIFDPFETGRAWHLPSALDVAAMRAAAATFLGRHDFAAFAANRGHPVENTARTIRRVELRQRGARLTLEFEGDGFLYHMVRLMVGTLVRCAQGRASIGRIAELLDAGKAGPKTSFS